MNPQTSFLAALARRGDPATSHIAALTVDVSAKERIVLEMLECYPDGLAERLEVAS